ARGHACRGRRRLRHTHGRRRVSAQARGVTRVPGRLILVRHGQSAWNLENLFTGWTDVDLSDAGRAEAGQAGRELLGADVAADVAFTSVLKRAIRSSFPPPSRSPARSRASCPCGTRASLPSCARARASSSSRTATACAPW